MIAPCAEPGCPQPAAYRGRCRAHARVSERGILRAGYHLYRTKRWRLTRERQLRDHPLCECGAIAEHVHHRTDLAAGGAAFDPANLQSLCASCHSRETRQRQVNA